MMGLDTELPPVDIERSKAQRAEEERKIEETHSRISAVPKGNRALHELSKVGIERNKLINYLWLIRSLHGKKPKNLAAVPGVPLRTIKKLPELLRTISRQVEAIEKHGYSLTTDQMRMLMCIPRLQGRFMAAKELPVFLRIYAHHLSGLLLMWQNRANRIDLDTELKVQLVQFVLETSRDRKQHYRELATLLDVFYQTEGVVSKNRQAVSAESLKVLWKSHPILRKLPEPISYPPVLTSYSKLN
jgi:hypothetical protein